MKKFLTVAFIAMLMVCICVGGALIAQAEVLDHDHAWVDGVDQGTKECSDPNCDAVCGTTEHPHSEIWVQTGDHTQHYKVCEICEAELTTPEDCGGGNAIYCYELPVCSTCNKTYGDEYGTQHTEEPVAGRHEDALAETHHTLYYDCCGRFVDEEHTPGKAATCQAGVECAVCGNTYGAIDPENHDWSNSTYTYVDANQHKQTCGCGHADRNVAHSGGTATCSVKAVCDVCKTAYGDLNDVHSYDNACDADCNWCGATRTPAEHTFGDWKVTKEPTETQTGEQERVCTVCGEKQTATISVITNPNGAGDPGADDSSSKTMVIIIVVVAVVVVAGAVVAFVLISKKKKK